MRRDRVAAPTFRPHRPRIDSRMARPAKHDGAGEGAWLDRWAVFFLRHRAMVLAAIGLITAAAAWTTIRTPYRGQIVEAFIDDLAEYDSYRRRCAEFGDNSDEIVFV